MKNNQDILAEFLSHPNDMKIYLKSFFFKCIKEFLFGLNIECKDKSLMFGGLFLLRPFIWFYTDQYIGLTAGVTGRQGMLKDSKVDWTVTENNSNSIVFELIHN